MRISLESNIQQSNHLATEVVQDDSANISKSSITPFEDILEVAKGGLGEEESTGRIIQASDLSVDELANLYNELGITSPAGKPVDNTTYVSTGAVDVPSDYVPMFEEASKKYGVAYNLLVSVACAESNFNPNCTSSAGAMGVMQLMPATAKYLGVSNPYDAKENIMGGARYLAEKLKEHGSVKLGIAAYNAGSGAVEKYNGVPPYTETQNYVKKILSFLGTDGSESGLITGTANVGSVNSVSNPAAAEAYDDITVSVANETMTYTAYLKYLELLDAVNS